jgi:pyruvate,water dikinase
LPTAVLAAEQFETCAAGAAVGSAIEFGVIARVEKGPVEPARVAADCGLTVRGAETLLGALAALGLLTQEDDGRFRPAFSALSAFAELLRPWASLGPALRGVSRRADAATTAGAESLYPNVVQQLAQLFRESAEHAAGLLMEPNARVLDIGAGAAPWSLALAARDPGCAVTAVELPAVIARTRSAVRAAGLDRQYVFVEGDAFEVDWGARRSFDLALVANFCHLLDDNANIRLLPTRRGAPGRWQGRHSRRPRERAWGRIAGHGPLRPRPAPANGAGPDLPQFDLSAAAERGRLRGRTSSPPHRAVLLQPDHSAPAMRPAPLSEQLDERLVGGKAAQLGAAVRAGLPVPGGIVLPVEFVGAVAAGRDEARRALGEACDALRPPLVARSSAVGEDSKEASFAGQHLTRLNLRSLNELVSAVCAIRESACSPAALAYRERLGLPPEASIAVVVQELVDADTAGVLFTRDPVIGTDELVIEAAWGLGEAVVAGLVTPDRYRLALDGTVLERASGLKDVAVRIDPAGGTRETAVPEELARAFCLDDTQLAALQALAHRCDQVFGGTHDLEWAFSSGRLYLLQRRALTAIPALPVQARR